MNPGPLNALAERWRDNRSWTGTAAALWGILDPQHAGGETPLPATGSALSQRLRRIAPALRAVGVEVSWARAATRDRTRTITLRAI